MTASTVSSIAHAFAQARPHSETDYLVVAIDGFKSSKAYLATSRAGSATMIVPLGAADGRERVTRELSLRGVPVLEYSNRGELWRGAAAVVECRDPTLLHAFAGMVAAMAARLDACTAISWRIVTSLFTDWERMFAQRSVLSDERELGLWGELWCLFRSRRKTELLAGWLGPEAEVVDFLLDGKAFEVKATRTAGSHMVAQRQVDTPTGDIPASFVSLHVMQDPVKGKSLSQLVDEVGLEIDDVAAFEEKLVAAGYFRDDAGSYHRRYVVAAMPSLYSANDVPRVRMADRGVSNLRYRVCLDPTLATQGDGLEDLLRTLGLELVKEHFPCV